MVLLLSLLSLLSFKSHRRKDLTFRYPLVTLRLPSPSREGRTTEESDARLIVWFAFGELDTQEHMPRRALRSIGDKCPKCGDSIDGSNVYMRGPKKTQVACAKCYNEYKRGVMADRRQYAEHIKVSFTVRESKEWDVTYGKGWLRRWLAYNKAYGEAMRERDAGVTPERLAELSLEFKGYTWDTWTPANGQ